MRRRLERPLVSRFRFRARELLRDFREIVRHAAAILHQLEPDRSPEAGAHRGRAKVAAPLRKERRPRSARCAFDASRLDTELVDVLEQRRRAKQEVHVWPSGAMPFPGLHVVESIEATLEAPFQAFVPQLADGEVRIVHRRERTRIDRQHSVQPALLGSRGRFNASKIFARYCPTAKAAAPRAATVRRCRNLRLALDTIASPEQE